MRLYTVERVALRFYERKVSILYLKIHPSFFGSICPLALEGRILLFSLLFFLYSPPNSLFLWTKILPCANVNPLFSQFLTFHLPNFNHSRDKNSSQVTEAFPWSFFNLLMAGLIS